MLINTQQTAEEKTKQQLQRICTSSYKQLLFAYKQGIRLVKQNPYGLSEEQVWECLGESANKLIEFATLTKNTLNAAVPNTIEDNE